MKIEKKEVPLTTQKGYDEDSRTFIWDGAPVKVRNGQDLSENSWLDPFNSSVTQAGIFPGLGWRATSKEVAFIQLLLGPKSIFSNTTILPGRPVISCLLQITWLSSWRTTM